MKVDSLLRFINSVVDKFQTDKQCEDESFIISPNLCEIAKPFISIKITYCEVN